MAPNPFTIDLTLDDDDAVSAEGQTRIVAIIQAKADAKVKEAQRRQELREAGKRERTLQNLEVLRSGKAQALELLSDEESTVRSSSNAHRIKVNPNTLRRDTPKKTPAGPSSILEKSPAAKGEPKRPDAGHPTSSFANSRPAPSEVSSSFRTTQQRVKDHQPLQTTPSAKNMGNEPKLGLASTTNAPSRVSTTTEKDEPTTGPNKDGNILVAPSTTQEASPSATESLKPIGSIQRNIKMKSSATNNNTRFDSNANNFGNPGIRSPKRSPMPKEPPKEPKDSRSLDHEHAHTHAEKSSTPDPSRFLTARIDAYKNVLPTPALTPASLADNVDDAEQSAGIPEIVRLHTDDIKCILRRHQDALRGHQEDLVKHRLRNARELHQSFSGPERKSPSVNPFKSLFSGMETNTNPIMGEKQQRVVEETSCVPAKAGSKPTSVSLQTSGFSTNAQEVPKVKSIGRLGASRNLLARNVEILTHMPWFSDNETDHDYQQGEKRYSDVRQEYEIDIKTRSTQRRCRAISTMWKPQVMKLLAELGIEVDDVLYYLLHEDARERPAAGTLSPEMDKVWYDRAAECESCGNKACIGPEGKRISFLTKRPPTERRLAISGLLCAEFIQIASINLWHVVSETVCAKKFQQDYLEQLDRTDHQPTNILRTFCYACCQFKCVTHGAYINADEVVSNENSISDDAASSQADNDRKASSDDDDISEAGPQKEVVLDDPELSMNTRVYAALPLREKATGKHKCGVFCLSMDVPVAAMLGRQSDGAISGAARLEMQDTEETTFDDSRLCESRVCFWKTKHREQEQFEMVYQDAGKLRSLLGDKEDLFQTLFPMELTSRRGPCELALVFSGVTCLEIFYFMLCSFRVTPHSDIKEPDIANMASGIKIDLSNDKMLEHRNSFVPCSHAGPCQPGTCSCADDKVSCEPSCGCSRQCLRRFKGCTCRDQRRKVCFEDNRCECWANNRECYPDLCASCGVQEVLDPVNKSRQDLDLRCRNNRIQLGIPKRTVMGVSEVHGWGLYAGEAIVKSDFISEYKGELISVEEGNRRGGVYHNLGLEYLFKLSKDQELDGSRVSNKARFINNSSLTKNINVLPKLLLCNGVSRIMLYAARDIAAGEELFYEYGYHKLKRANFKEKPDTARRTILPMSLSKTTSLNIQSLVTSTAPSLHSEPELFVTHHEDDSNEPQDQSVLPTSEPDSEFDIPEEVAEETSSDSENSDDTPHPRFMPRPVVLRRPASKVASSTNPTRHDDLFSSPPHSPNNRPKKKPRLSLSQPKAPRDPDPDTGNDTPSRKQGEPDTTSDKTGQSKGIKKDNKRLRTLADGKSERKRRISPNDKRLGGEVQRRTAESLRRKKAEQKAAKLAGVETPTGHERKRSEAAATSPAQEPNSSQPLTKVKLKLTRPKQLASRFSITPLPEPPPPFQNLPEGDMDMDQDQDFASVSESDRSASSNKRGVPDVALQTNSFSLNASRQAIPSGFGSESTRSIPRSSPSKAQPAKSAGSKQPNNKHLLGCAPG